jgi:hypothetical protein
VTVINVQKNVSQDAQVRSVQYLWEFVENCSGVARSIIGLYSYIRVQRTFKDDWIWRKLIIP